MDSNTMYQDLADRHAHLGHVENLQEHCKKNLYQPVQIETTDGKIHQGILHSFDHEKLYLLMQHPSVPRADFQYDQQEERLFRPFGLFGFPFFGLRRFSPFFPFFW